MQTLNGQEEDDPSLRLLMNSLLSVSQIKVDGSIRNFCINKEETMIFIGIKGHLLIYNLQNHELLRDMNLNCSEAPLIHQVGQFLLILYSEKRKNQNGIEEGWDNLLLVDPTKGSILDVMKSKPVQKILPIDETQFLLFVDEENNGKYSIEEGRIEQKYSFECQLLPQFFDAHPWGHYALILQNSKMNFLHLNSLEIQKEFSVGPSRTFVINGNSVYLRSHLGVDMYALDKEANLNFVRSIQSQSSNDFILASFNYIFVINKEARVEAFNSSLTEVVYTSHRRLICSILISSDQKSLYLQSSHPKEQHIIHLYSLSQRVDLKNQPLQGFDLEASCQLFKQAGGVIFCQTGRWLSVFEMEKGEKKVVDLEEATGAEGEIGDVGLVHGDIQNRFFISFKRYETEKWYLHIFNLSESVKPVASLELLHTPGQLVASKNELVPHAIFICDHYLHDGFLRKAYLTQDNQIRAEEVLKFQLYFDVLKNDTAIVNAFILTNDEKNGIFMVQKQSVYVVNFEQFATIQRIYLEHPCNEVRLGTDEYHLRILYQNMFEELDWVSGRQTLAIKMEEDFFTFLNLRNTHFIVWNLNSIQVFELKRRFCKVKIPYDQPNFLALDQEQRNLFVQKDKQVFKWNLWTTSKEHSEKSFCRDENKFKFQELGLLDFTVQFSEATLEYSISSQKCRVYDFQNKFLCYFSLKNMDWEWFGTVISLLELDQLGMVSKIKRTHQDNLLTPLPVTDNSVLHLIALKKKALDALFGRLEMVKKKKLPLLFFVNSEGQSPIDIAIENNQIISTRILVQMVLKYCNNPFYNKLMDKNLCRLLEDGFNLTEYFKSNLPFFEVTLDQFPILHSDSRTLIVGTNEDSIRTALNSYEALFSNKLSPMKSEWQKYPIQYLVVNLPLTLTQDPIRFTEAITNSSNIEIFDTPVIQTIIDYYWNTFTLGQFRLQLLIFMTFFLVFLVDVFLTVDNQAASKKVGVWCKIICSVILVYFTYYEVVQVSRFGPRKYTKSVWNYFDFIMILTYVPTALSDFLLLDRDLVIGLFCLMILLTFIKFCFFLRGFSGYSYLVTLIQAVIQDIFFFVSFYLMVLVAFTLIFYTQQIALSEAYDGLSQIDYAIMVFRTSVGDFEVDNFKDSTSLMVVWVSWFLTVFVLNILLMNFLIAVISESYARIMKKMTAQNYRTKAQIVLEREYMLSEEDLRDDRYFPRYLILRRQAVDLTVDEGQEIQTLQKQVTELKLMQRQLSQKLEANIGRKMQAMMDEMKQSLLEELKQKH